MLAPVTAMVSVIVAAIVATVVEVVAVPVVAEPSAIPIAVTMSGIESGGNDKRRRRAVRNGPVGISGIDTADKQQWQDGGEKQEGGAKGVHRVC